MYRRSFRPKTGHEGIIGLGVGDEQAVDVQSGAVQERAVSLVKAWTWDVTITSAGWLEPTMGGDTLTAIGRASSHFTSRHPARGP